MTSFTDQFFSTPALCEVMGDDALLRHMAEFEAALAGVQGRLGIIPADAAALIAGAARAMSFNRPELFADARKAGTLAIPLVKALTAEVRRADPGAAAFVHVGATSQDVIDTAMMLQLRGALALIRADGRRLAEAAARLAREHRASLMLGRTLLQPATPVTFGLKAAQWLVGALDALAAVDHHAALAVRLQFGGAAGNLGSLAGNGPAVALEMARELFPGTEPALLPWHTRRGALASFAGTLAVLTGVCGKIARDITLMMQSEVAEAFEGAEAGRGGSSAMPHKQNPVRSMQILANAARAPFLAATIMAGLAQEHERGLGGWQAEWAVLPDLVRISGGAAALGADLLETLRVDPARMRANFDALRGLPLTEAAALALSHALGRDGAHAAVEAAARGVVASGRTLSEVLKGDKTLACHLSAAEIDALSDPANALGATQGMIDGALALLAGKA